MKIDKSNPLHWLYLSLLGVNVAMAVLLRPLLHQPGRRKVLLYGHKRSGNLLAIHEWVLKRSSTEMDMRYLTMDPLYYLKLRRQGVPCVLAISPVAIAWLGTVDAIVSDHGLHALRFLIGNTNIKFFDVWHGIPFKGFDAEDFRLQHQYDEVWVASSFMKEIYVKRLGFKPDQVIVTGYARTDALVIDKCKERNYATLRLGLPEGKKVVLFAPTWAQDDEGRSILPFGLDADDFYTRLSSVAQKEDALIVLRTHLNSAGYLLDVGEFPGLISLPYADWPNTEELLLVTDVLVCDWSSIAFDFVLLGRPTVFLDVAPPFKKGFTLDAMFRYGAIARDMNEVQELIGAYLRDPDQYIDRYGDRSSLIARSIYDSMADGSASERCVSRLKLALVNAEVNPDELT